MCRCRQWCRRGPWSVEMRGWKPWPSSTLDRCLCPAQPCLTSDAPMGVGSRAPSETRRRRYPAWSTLTTSKPPAQDPRALRTRTRVPLGSVSSAWRFVVRWWLSMSARGPGSAQPTHRDGQRDGDQRPRAEEEEERHHQDFDPKAALLEKED